MSEVITKIWARIAGRRNEASSQLVGNLLESEGAHLKAVENKPRRLFNREISDLLFIERVMEESENRQHPLFERVRFLAISADVLDQFYAVRVAKMRRSVAKKDGYLTPDGLSPMQQLAAVSDKGNAMMAAQQKGWEVLKEELSAHDIVFPDVSELDDESKAWLKQHFLSHYLHVLTPFTIDEEHPFPFIPSGGLSAVLEFRDGFILLPIPMKARRFVKIPGGSQHRFVSLDQMIEMFWNELVPGEKLLGSGVFQILRDNDLAREERSDDLRSIVESGLKLRHKANVIRLKVSPTMTESALKFIAENLGLLDRQEIKFMENRHRSMTSSGYITSAPLVGLPAISEIIDDLGSQFPGLLFTPFHARYPAQLEQFQDDCFAAMRERDIAVHWPFESFDSVIRFLDQAAEDPDVVSIKQTLYRTNDQSPIVEALVRAAEAGKTVLAVVELEARDNEQSNIELAKQMEDAGVQIVYGIIGLKIHCKATLVVRMEDDEAITYTHLGSGNYHPKNAKTYTDISYFTRDQKIGHDTHLVFSYLTSEKVQPPSKLAVAPHFLRKRLFEHVDQEIENAKAGKPAHICIKVNSFTDPEMTERLYAASEAGVQVDLIIRRHCVLIPGVPGMSSNIRVKSVVGRFLEHSRIYLFAGGAEMSAETAHVYFGSADMMERNLDERAEILVPVTDAESRRMLLDGVMHAYLIDTTQSWELTSDNEYVRVESPQSFCAQTFFLSESQPEKLGRFSADTLSK